jgi:maltooligosyltrehalose synthase
MWGDTTLALPGHALTWHNWITGEAVNSTAKVNLSELLAAFPIAILIASGAE